MRTLPSRPALPATTNSKLAEETIHITATKTEKERITEADRKYTNARTTQWFMPVLDALQMMTGEGQRCMCCSSGEAAQVEHYRPKSKYPEQALSWTNLLWICGVCNLAKGDDFDENCLPINPAEENAWNYFFIDEYGNFCAKWAQETDSLHPRAVETIQLYGLDRQALQESRIARMQELKRLLDDSIALKSQDQLSENDLQIRALEFHANPLQPDVGDYFLNGPGCQEAPFTAFFAVAGL
jgi:hypothetical protein